MPRDAKAETRLEREFRDEIDAMAEQEDRQRSKMIEILLKEAVEARKNATKRDD